jgi:2-polyprenyl-3-methyl-5-hydroxy-6-metoxy-1,4-benzoquinol methylase
LNPRPTAESYNRFYENGGTEQSAYHNKLNVTYINLVLEKMLGNEFQPLSSKEVEENSTDPLEKGEYDNYGLDILNYLKEYIPTGSKVFEIGASRGQLLVPWKIHHGCEVGGVEPKRESVSDAQKYYQIDLMQGFSDCIKIPKNYYDLVMNVRTLDHMLDPLQELKVSRTWLREGGYIFVDVQDTKSRVAFKGLTGKVEIDHAYIFSQATLKALLQKAGYSVVKIESIDLSKVYSSESKTDSGRGLWQLRALARKSTVNDEVEWPNPVFEAVGYLKNSQIYEDKLKLQFNSPTSKKKKLTNKKKSFDGTKIINIYKKYIKNIFKPKK